MSKEYNIVTESPVQFVKRLQQELAELRAELAETKAQLKSMEEDNGRSYDPGRIWT